MAFLLKEYMPALIKLHTFILEDENHLPQQTIDVLAEETAHRRAEDIGWTSIVVRQLPVRVEENGKTLYVFEIFGFGEALEDEDDVVALIASQGPTRRIANSSGSLEVTGRFSLGAGS